MKFLVILAVAVLTQAANAGSQIAKSSMVEFQNGQTIQITTSFLPDDEQGSIEN